MYKFTKIAGMILDQQDDPGAGWESIAPFWPEHLPEPSVGQDIDKQACIATLTDGITKVAKYPVDTPSNTLASSMYFLAFGVESIDDPDDYVKIASELKEYRIAHNVSLPHEFVDFIKNAGQYEVEETYADEDERLPVTTPEQAQASIMVFSKNAHMWPTSERMLYSARLSKAAEHHGVKCDLPYASTELSKNASGSIDVRVNLMQELLPDEDIKEDYISRLGEIKIAMESNPSYVDMLKIAEDLESLDNEFGMNDAWGSHVPDPIDSLLVGVNLDPFASVDKHASMDWDSVDWDSLPFDSDVVDAIKDDPAVVIPTLPGPQRKIVEDYVYDK